MQSQRQEPQVGRPARRQALAAVLLLGTLAVLTAGEAAAEGRWVRGGGIDGFVPVAFARYVGEGEEARMTLRCDEVAGVNIDFGTTSTGVAPADTDVTGQASVGLNIISDAGSTAIEARGDVRILGPSVLVSLIGEAALEVATLLRIPADQVEVTVDGVTRITYLRTATGYANAAALFDAIAATCKGWPAVVEAGP